RPAIGFGHGGVDAVVSVLEDADQALLVNDFIPALDRLARAQLFKHVVHLGERELRMRLLARLAVSIELFAEVSQFPSLCGAAARKWEWIEANRVVVARPIFKRPTCR